MPADRLITVTLTTEGMRNEFGVYVPGVVTAYRMWATRMDKSQEDIEQEGGLSDSTRRDWRVRWFPLLSSTPASRVSVIDDGVTFDAINKVEVTGRPGQSVRRRFIDIQGIHTT